ncbi:MAG: BON domain-containing protein [Acidimicrobiales bacterium]
MSEQEHENDDAIGAAHDDDAVGAVNDGDNDDVVADDVVAADVVAAGAAGSTAGSVRSAAAGHGTTDEDDEERAAVAYGWTYLAVLAVIFGVIALLAFSCDSDEPASTMPAVTTTVAVDDGAGSGAEVTPVELAFVVAEDGTVTLTGAVPDEGARRQIVDAAVARFGEGNVVDQLTIDDGTTLTGARSSRPAAHSKVTPTPRISRPISSPHWGSPTTVSTSTTPPRRWSPSMPRRRWRPGRSSSLANSRTRPRSMRSSRQQKGCGVRAMSTARGCPSVTTPRGPAARFG